MGSSLGVSSCGGEASDHHSPSSEGGAAGSLTSASGGVTGVGGAELGIGGDAVSSGGALLSRGGATFTLGGSSGAGAARDEGEAGGGELVGVDSFAQLTCSRSCQDVTIASTTYAAAIVDATHCAVDVSKPKSAADCAANEWFECRLGVYQGDLVDVDCGCTAMLGATCACPRADTVTCQGNAKVCSCAITGILVK
jgi:hypothetical protein